MKGAKSKSTKADNKLAVKKDAPKAKPAKKGKAGKDPNKPKRPQSAFFVFMAEFRVQFKEKNPRNKSVAAVGKAGGDKWKTMTDAEKAPYIEKANKLKAQYTKDVAAYDKKQTEKPQKSREEDEESEVNDDAEDDDEEGEEEDDDDDE